MCLWRFNVISEIENVARLHYYPVSLYRFKRIDSKRWSLLPGKDCVSNDVRKGFSERAATVHGPLDVARCSLLVAVKVLILSSMMSRETTPSIFACCSSYYYENESRPSSGHIVVAVFVNLKIESFDPIFYSRSYVKARSRS
jgi:hypothetical protein